MLALIRFGEVEDLLHLLGLLDRARLEADVGVVRRYSRANAITRSTWPSRPVVEALGGSIRTTVEVERFCVLNSLLVPVDGRLRS